MTARIAAKAVSANTPKPAGGRVVFVAAEDWVGAALVLLCVLLTLSLVLSVVGSGVDKEVGVPVVVSNSEPWSFVMVRPIAVTKVELDDEGDCGELEGGVLVDARVIGGNEVDGRVMMGWICRLLVSS